MSVKQSRIDIFNSIRRGNPGISAENPIFIAIRDSYIFQRQSIRICAVLTALGLDGAVAIGVLCDGTRGH